MSRPSHHFQVSIYFFPIKKQTVEVKSFEAQIRSRIERLKNMAGHHRSKFNQLTCEALQSLNFHNDKPHISEHPLLEYTSIDWFQNPRHKMYGKYHSKFERCRAQKNHNEVQFRTPPSSRPMRNQNQGL